MDGGMNGFCHLLTTVCYLSACFALLSHCVCACNVCLYSCVSMCVCLSSTAKVIHYVAMAVIEYYVVFLFFLLLFFVCVHLALCMHSWIYVCMLLLSVRVSNRH